MFKKSILVGSLFFLFLISSNGANKGFCLLDKVQYHQDIMHTYEHRESGLKLVWIQNEDINKGFSLGVKTPSQDSTGVNHIIEHTVFTGSKKYPSPNLFFDASAAYPNIYMNALTSQDMTIYPFITPYQECYMELLAIYLDSIFYPNMLVDPSGFYEESFYYNPDTKTIGGIVYHEMQGASLNIERILYKNIRENIYEGTYYANDSGGEPNVIPTLTYEAFKNTYHKYYYPGNMQIVLYGDLPIDEVLSVIEHYLKDHTYQQGISLKTQLSTKGAYKKLFTLPNKENPCLVKSFVIPKELTLKQRMDLDLWVEAYLLDEGATFRKALQQTELYHVEILKDNQLPYPVYSIIVYDIPVGKMKMYQQQLEEVLQKLQQKFKADAILEQRIIAKMQLESLLENQSSQRALYISQSILDSWAHQRALDSYYSEKTYWTKLKKLPVDTYQQFFEQSYSYTFELFPTEQIEDDPLQYSLISEQKWRTIVKEMEAWRTYMPKIAFEKIDSNKLTLPTQVQTKTIVKRDQVYIKSIIPKGLARSQLYYNTSHIEQEKLPYLFLYTYLLEQSSKELIPFKGRLEIDAMAFDNEEGYSPFVKLSILSAQQHTDHGGLFLRARAALLQKDDAWYEYHLRQWIQDFKQRSQSKVLEMLLSLGRGSVEDSKRYLYEKGYPLYDFSQQLTKNSQGTWINEVKQIDQTLYNQKGLIVAIASPLSWQNPYQKSWQKVLRHQPYFNIREPKYNFKQNTQQSVLIHNNEVDYLCWQYTDSNKFLDGVDYLVSSYVTKYYLIPHIRLRSGAYGVGCELGFLDTLLIYTYRDPNYQDSIEVIQKIPQYLRKKIDDLLLQDIKIQALAKLNEQFRVFEAPLEQIDIQEQMMLMGVPKTYKSTLQEQILKATPQELYQKARLFETFLEKGSLAIATKSYKKMQQIDKIYYLK